MGVGGSGRGWRKQEEELGEEGNVKEGDARSSI